MLKDYKKQIQDADLVLVGFQMDENCLRERVFIIHERDRSV